MTGSLIASWVADVAAIMTGAATVALAAVTVSLAHATRVAAKAGEEAARLAQRELQEAHRPLVVPEGLGDGADERHASLLVRNVGIGPAVNVYARVQLRDLPPGVLGRFPDRVIPAIPAGGTAELSFLAVNLDPRKLVSAELTFADVAGQRYATDAHWRQRPGSFHHLTVAEREGLRLEVIPAQTPAPPRWRRAWASLRSRLPTRAPDS